ncbi:putative Aspartate aminotransferase [Streptomyces afghaniensis 772]|uniref:Aminotransferase n=1 Tax=Streptomyces afghaniensis 772 TaxID=1283301 RepID=S4MJX0_9ACTN|nr:putative Aspartate aminotransferase [Streptomyces afghaniensis 772]
MGRMSAATPPTERRVSARVGAISESATLAVDAKAKALKAAGRPVIGFGAGEPDFPTPDYIVEAAIEACKNPKFHRYTPAGGLPELKAAIAAKTLRDSGLEVDASQILVTNGGKQAIYEAFAAILDPGDEVIVPAPYWTTYPESIRLAGGVPVEVVADETTGYRVTVEQLEAARTEKTKVVLFVSPSNPTGAVYGEQETEAIGRWAVEHGLWVMTDEIYEHLVYGDASAVSLPAVLPELRDKCIVVNGVAKTYAMTGWRVGWIIGRRTWSRPRRTSSRTPRRTCPTSPRPPRWPPSPATCRRREDAGGLRPAPQDHRADAERDRRRGVPGAGGRVLRLPVGQGAGRQGDPGPAAQGHGRAGRADPGGGRGRGGAG